MIPVENLIGAILDEQNRPALFAALAAFAAVFSIILPYLSDDKLGKRMKYVAEEREEMRRKSRARMNLEVKGSLRHEKPRTYMEQVVDRFNLRKLMEDGSGKEKLRMAGLRGDAPVVTFLFARFVAPFIMFAVALFYLYGVESFGITGFNRVLAALFIAFIGFYLPNVWVTNMIQKRQRSIRRAWPDALDLMLICVESGMSIEQAMRKVAHEIGSQSIELAEEMTLTVAELSYLTERRQAYDNLARRTGLEGVKSVCMALVQSERYGTPIGAALRVLAQENRDYRMSMAEKKAASLPPKLTVPMIVFFLPPLFVIILGPAFIQLKATGAV